MGAPKSYRNNRTRVRKLENTGERRAGRLDADAGRIEHRAEVASIEEASRRKLIVEQGINPETGQLYPSIATHRDALGPYWSGLTNGEMARIKSTIWRQIDPSPEGAHTGTVVTHPSYHGRLANA